MRALILVAALTACSVVPQGHKQPVSQTVPSYVLDCAGSTGNAPHVNHGWFYPTDESELGVGFVQAWVMPRNSGSRYFLSAGYGGAHQWLLGFVQWSTGGPNYVYAQTWDGSSPWAVTGSTGIAPGTWVHVAAGWDGDHLRVYVNGQPDGAVAFSGPRRNVTLNNGGGQLFVCGSTHSNFDGRIVALEIFEGSYPLVLPSSGFGVTRWFRSQSWNGSTATPASFLAYYTVPSGLVQDLSDGYNGQRHPGSLFAGAAGEDRGVGYGQPWPPPSFQFGSGALPTWVVDTSAPTAVP